MNLRDITAAARNVSHDLVAIVGISTGSTGAILLALNALGVHVGAEQVDGVLTAAGYAATILSKAIDSANDAVTSSSAPPAAPLATAQSLAPLPGPVSPGPAKPAA